MFNVSLVYSNGSSAVLSVKNREYWKTKKTAIKHAQDIAHLKTRTGIMKELSLVNVEDECGTVFKSFAIA